MEELFTRASVAVELFGFGYVAGSFVVYTHHRLTQAAQWKPRPIGATTQAPLPPEQPKTEKKRKLSPVELLRQQCQEAGIKWRHAHGKNKHLKKAEMIEALQKLEQSKREQSKKVGITLPKPAIAADKLRKAA
jgi:predicted secreted protein